MNHRRAIRQILIGAALTITAAVPAAAQTTAYDIAGTWNDHWTQAVCGYACSTPVGNGGTTTLVLVADTSTTFHGTYFGIFPISGQITGASISYAWANYPTGVGPAQGTCQGTASATSMSLTCSEWIQSPDGLQLNGSSSDVLSVVSHSGGGGASAAQTVYNIASGDVGGLIAAIQMANAGGGGTINLAAHGTYTLTAVAEDGSSYYGCCGTLGLPYIRSQIVIHGNGATIQRSTAEGTPLFGILGVAEPGDLTMDEVTLTGGHGSPTAPSNAVGGLGLDRGRVSIRDVTITGNTSDGTFWTAGGILNFCGTLTVLNSTISYNTGPSGYGGGGLLQFSYTCSPQTPQTTISFSTFFENRNTAGRGDSVSTAFAEAGSMVVKNSILASPTQGTGNACYGTLPVSGGHNVAGDDSCALTGPGDMNTAQIPTWDP